MHWFWWIHINSGKIGSYFMLNLKVMWNNFKIFCFDWFSMQSIEFSGKQNHVFSTTYLLYSITKLFWPRSSWRVWHFLLHFVPRRELLLCAVYIRPLWLLGVYITFRSRQRPFFAFRPSRIKFSFLCVLILLSFMSFFKKNIFPEDSFSLLHPFNF